MVQLKVHQLLLLKMLLLKHRLQKPMNLLQLLRLPKQQAIPLLLLKVQKMQIRDMQMLLLLLLMLAEKAFLLLLASQVRLLFLAEVLLLLGQNLQSLLQVERVIRLRFLF